jgi:hypothetical protein
MAKSEAEAELGPLHELNRNIEVVIALLLRSITRDASALPLKEQIAILDGLGIRPVTIARIVGKKPSHVSKELVAIRRAHRK